MLDLGASINIMHVSLYRELGLTNLRKLGLVIQLVDRSCIKHLGIVVKILITIEDLIFPADCYVLDMPASGSNTSSAALLLGRPFMKRTKADIDVDEGVVSVGFQDKTLTFRVFDDVDPP